MRVKVIVPTRQGFEQGVRSLSFRARQIQRVHSGHMVNFLRGEGIGGGLDPILVVIEEA
jgi:hypothetical protein